MAQSLAVKYRPKTFSDVIGQDNIVKILQSQIDTNAQRNTYLFVGPAGDGKTTCARILANELNKGQGLPIELDAASHNGVDDVRSIIDQAQTKSLDSEYKVFIVDECHALSNNAWQALLKLIEEPPAKAIFIFCTTNPEKIPRTIISRVQRYDFRMLSQEAIIQRLKYVCDKEAVDMTGSVDDSALEYIAKLADGHMRDALTMLDQCLAYSYELTLENVINVLGAVDYDSMMELTDNILNKNDTEVIDTLNDIYNSGKDIKLFWKQYTYFLIDISKYRIGCDWKYINIPKVDKYTAWLDRLTDAELETCFELMKVGIKLNAEIKYSAVPKLDIEAMLMTF